MFSLDHLRQLATKYQTTELNVHREYVQHLFLSYFYQQSETDQIYFKGGTALRVIYHSPRFSADLDFSAPQTPTARIENALEKTLSSLQKANLNPNLHEAKTTTGGYLATISFPSSTHPTQILLEISQRPSNITGQITTIVNDFAPTYTLVAMSSGHLAAEKIAALLGRKKPRDFYDLYFILRANLLPPEQKQVLHQVKAVLAKTDLNFATELKLFLPKSHWATIRDFKTTLETEINRYI